MPWSPEEFRRKFNKQISNASSMKASSIANSILAKGGSDAEAVRTANSQVRPSYKRRLQKIREKKGMPSG